MKSVGNLPSGFAKRHSDTSVGGWQRLALKGLWLPTDRQPQGSLSRLPSDFANRPPGGLE